VASRTTTQDPIGTESLMPGDENEVTRPSDLGFGSREVEVEPMIQQEQVPMANDGTVVVTMATTIEEFTHGNPHYSTKLEQGKQYRMPVEIARYLWGIGKLR
jgi:hypothetical protein